MTVEIYPHQQKAVDAMHNGCILWGGVGVGKTITSLVYFYTKVCGGVVGDRGSMRNPRDLIVITPAKKRDSFDWETDAAKLGIVKERDGSVSGITLTVDSWNNIDKYTEVKDAFFIFDEQRVVGSGTWTKAFVEIGKNNPWILLSATPGDTWMDYIPVFLANGFYKNRTEFLRKHVVFKPYVKWPQVERYTGVGHLLKLRNSVLVEMPYERHTTREINYVPVEYDKELLNEKVMKKRWHVYEERPLRDVAELFLVMRKVVNSDSSRLRAITELLERHPKLIVFYNFDYELEMLRTLNRSLSSPSQSTCETDTAACSPSSGTDLILSPTGPEKDVSAQDASLESRPSSTEAEPWQYLTSPEGKAENERLEGSSSKLTSKTSSTSANSGLGSETESDTGTTTFAVAEWNGHKHQPIPTTDRWVYLVQYQAGAEGWNCVETDAMVFYSLTYSYKNWHQAFGRIDRLNTPFSLLKYYVLMSESVIDKGILRALKNKKNFNEAKFVAQL